MGRRRIFSWLLYSFFLFLLLEITLRVFAAILPPVHALFHEDDIPRTIRDDALIWKKIPIIPITTPAVTATQACRRMSALWR